MKTTQVLKKVYDLLDIKQKVTFIVIVFIMIFSSVLTQITPKAIGWLTDDILSFDTIDFFKVIPILLVILIVNIVNEVIIITRRILVEDIATKTEKRREVWLFLHYLRRHLIILMST